MSERIKIGRAALLATCALATASIGAIAVIGCGDSNPSAGTTSQSTPAPRPSPEAAGIPDSLRTVESGAEDTTDFILAGQRARAVEAANALNDAAHGQAATDLSAAGVATAQIDQLKTRASAVARIADSGKPIDVALAANRAFELVPDFFAAYTDPVPSEVIRLDYLDFEAKLQALAGNRDKAADAVSQLDERWSALRKEVLAAGGKAPAAHFDSHVQKLRSLLKSGSDKQLANEAQHGLDLVDQLERVYTR